MRTYRAGKLLGVPLLIHPSLALICVPVAIWMAGAERYVAPHRGHSASIALGLAGALIYCASIVLHECGHLVVARRFGLPIESLTVNAWGGRIRGSGKVPGPEADAAVAAAGPAATLLLIALGAAALFALGPHVGAFARGAAFAVLILNLAILPGCIVPVWPTDAARVLRAVAWKLGGDPRAATRLACLVGLALIALALEAGVLFLLHPSVPGSQTTGVLLTGCAALLLPQAWAARRYLRRAAEVSAA